MKCHCYHGRSLEQVYIFEYGGSAYLLIVDYFSKYPEVCLLQGKSASAVISHFQDSVCETRTARNSGRRQYMPFDSSEMRKFAAEYGFATNTSNSEHAASYGQSERMIGTVKRLMRKANEVAEPNWLTGTHQ